MLEDRKTAKFKFKHLKMIDDMRRELHDYIDASNEKFIELMYVMAKKYTQLEDVSGHDFATADLERFEARRNSRINGESEVYSWEDAKAKILGKAN